MSNSSYPVALTSILGGSLIGPTRAGMRTVWDESIYGRGVLKQGSVYDLVMFTPTCTCTLYRVPRKNFGLSFVPVIFRL